MVTIVKQGAQTFGKGIQLLQLLSDADGPLGLSEAARSLALHKNTVYRLLNELERQDFVSREVDGTRYVVGSGLIALSARVLRRVSLRGAARPFMEKVAADTGETVTLHVRHMRNRICVDTVPGQHPIRRVVQIGETLPIYLGSTGKVQLAYLRHADRAAILEWAAQQGVDCENLKSQLKHIRQLGYMAAVSERTLGVGGLSAPVFDNAAVVAALTVSGPGQRWDQSSMDEYAPTLIMECSRLSAQLGAPSQPPTVMQGV